MSPPQKSKGPRRDEPTFEAALARLEEIVVALEGGERPLEESLRLFEEGIALTRRCAARLDHAQRRIDLLSRDARGEPVLAPFEPDTAGEREAGADAPDEADDADETDDADGDIAGDADRPDEDGVES
jgi:exodeoxyribonuclease VII small subunit